MIARLVIAVVLIGTIAAGTSPSLAKPKSTKDSGLTACYVWCNEHNKTDKSIIACEDGCDRYYHLSVQPVPSAL